jgi:hypothetical protein
MLKARDGPPEPTSKKDEKVVKLEFEVLVQKDDEIMSYDGAHLKEKGGGGGEHHHMIRDCTRRAI